MIDYNWEALKAEKEDYGRHYDPVPTFGHKEFFIFRIFESGSKMLTVGKQNFFVSPYDARNWRANENRCYEAIHCFFTLKRFIRLSIQKVSIADPLTKADQIMNLKLVFVNKENDRGHKVIEQVWLMVDGKHVAHSIEGVYNKKKKSIDFKFSEFESLNLVTENLEDAAFGEKK